jgi:hypothetical protein
MSTEHEQYAASVTRIKAIEDRLQATLGAYLSTSAPARCVCTHRATDHDGSGCMADPCPCTLWPREHVHLVSGIDDAEDCPDVLAGGARCSMPQVEEPDDGQWESLDPPEERLTPANVWPMAEQWHTASDHAADGVPFDAPLCNCFHIAERAASLGWVRD